MLDHRKDCRVKLDGPATIYDKQGNFFSSCIVRDFSNNGGRLELAKEAPLPAYFFLSLMPDGSSRRLCSKVWQIVRMAGVRFVQK
jgi:hypothetical protein